MILFTPGPVNQSHDLLRELGKQDEYFRTEKFSVEFKLLRERFKRVLSLPSDYEVLFITTSGTGAMEFASNFCNQNDFVSVINSGNFGKRFAEICDVKKLEYELCEVDLQQNFYLPFEPQGNIVHLTLADTSSGYAIPSNSCEELKNKFDLVIADAVTALFTERLDISKFDILYSASQKGIGCSPGVSFIICSPRALERVEKMGKSNSLYLDPLTYITEARRNQVPFTPNLSVLRQIKFRINQLEDPFGYEQLVQSVETRALSFRNEITKMDISIATKSLAHCVTNFRINSLTSSSALVENLANSGIQIAPNPPDYFGEFVRVAHFGKQEPGDYKKLISAIRKATVK